MQGQNLRALHLEGKVLTSGLPEKSHLLNLNSFEMMKYLFFFFLVSRCRKNKRLKWGILWWSRL